MKKQVYIINNQQKGTYNNVNPNDFILIENTSEVNTVTLYSDYSLTQTGTLPTTLTKLNFNGATLVGESANLFDATNSRIKKMELNSVGKANVSFELDTSSGTSHWVELQIKGYDNTDTLLFSKRPVMQSLPKNVATDYASINLDFYFGPAVEYLEIYIKASSAIPYTNPAITIFKL